ncbi:hypothetical protein [Chryseobacterium sp. BIGb0232]|uniref:hypothetical protein n=1 Tax=Chryseobacterium sp. BIGb0232 TaxID=2940598 RepID=UPI000F4A04B3|nr:hypothetical protein [Chryseobacterium sp. BIGb0232]MCS4305639.1 putative glycosyltransferase [Chryseobacterium sp. BIGb0232]ROS20749.1 hypothetical protein EDF65_1482 [Chryseobacterium nakagawai]
MVRILFLIALFYGSVLKSQDLNHKKFYAQIHHSCVATTNGAYDRYTFLVLEFKNNVIYPAYLQIPSGEQNSKDPVTYKYENKILYLTKTLGFKEDPGMIFKYVNGNLVPQNKKSKPGLIFKPSLKNYFNKIK